MAKRGRVRTVYRKAKRRYAKRASGLGGLGGRFKPAIAGAICGAGPSFAQPFLGQWATPVVCGAVGYLMKDPTSLWFAGYSAGGMIGNGGSGIASGGVR